jgi:hypothetical protein
VQVPSVDITEEPRFTIVLEVDGQTMHIHVQPPPPDRHGWRRVP